MTLSTCVVLTTYNGMKYIEPLVDSLRLQTRRIDEVLICDDGSKDETVSFLQDYIDKHCLSGWKIVVNKKNKGWKKNFRDGILAAQSDLVFPCDQDDIWEIEKIEKMTAVFESNDKVILLASDYTPIYERGGKKVDSFEKSTVERLIHIKDDEQFSTHLRPGCVMAVRRSFIVSAADIWEDTYAHDAFMWTVSSIEGGTYMLNVPLVKFRRHNNNTSTGIHRTIKNQIELMEMGESIVRWYRKQHEIISPEKEHVLEGYMNWSYLRKELLKDRKLIDFFRLIQYHSYFRSMRQEVGDLYYLMRGR